MTPILFVLLAATIVLVKPANGTLLTDSVRAENLFGIGDLNITVFFDPLDVERDEQLQSLHCRTINLLAFQRHHDETDLIESLRAFDYDSFDYFLQLRKNGNYGMVARKILPGLRVSRGLLCFQKVRCMAMCRSRIGKVYFLSLLRLYGELRRVCGLPCTLPYHAPLVMEPEYSDFGNMTVLPPEVILLIYSKCINNVPNLSVVSCLNKSFRKVCKLSAVINRKTARQLEQLIVLTFAMPHLHLQHMAISRQHLFRHLTDDTLWGAVVVRLLLGVPTKLHNFIPTMASHHEAMPQCVLEAFVSKPGRVKRLLRHLYNSLWAWRQWRGTNGPLSGIVSVARSVLADKRVWRVRACSGTLKRIMDLLQTLNYGVEYGHCYSDMHIDMDME